MTLTVQLPLAGMVAPLIATLPALAAPAKIAPAQLLLKLGVAAMTTPMGKVSVNAAPVITAALPLVRVIVSTDVAPALMLIGAKALLADGGARISTVSVMVLFARRVAPSQVAQATLAVLITLPGAAFAATSTVTVITG